MKQLLPFLVLAAFVQLPSSADAQKLKVYILAGQSNMQGHAKVATFDYIGEDKETAHLLKAMRGSDGKPVVRNDVWISYLTGGRGGNAVISGKLTAGFGARRNPQKDDGKIGPELTFGIRMGEAHKEPVLLIKTAWGGKSLHTDFRSPSAGDYGFSAQQLERFEKQKKDVAQMKADKKARTGVFYRAMIEHVKAVLADPKKVVPSYKKSVGYELAGFVWFQGWNDMVDRGTYPQRDKPGGYAQYSENMAHFIRDVRKDLGAPKLPFVIGVMGVGGPIAEADAKKRRVHANFREAMKAPASLEEFKGNVAAVPTAPYWDAKLQSIADKMGKVRHMARMLRTKNKRFPNKDGNMSPKEQRAYVDDYRLKTVGADDLATWQRGASNAAYHYLGCGKTMAQIGEAFAWALISLRSANRILNPRSGGK